jgi:hypothetical protein
MKNNIATPVLLHNYEPIEIDPYRDEIKKECEKSGLNFGIVLHAHQEFRKHMIASHPCLLLPPTLKSMREEYKRHADFLHLPAYYFNHLLPKAQLGGMAK